MLKLKNGNFLEAKVITGISIGKRSTKKEIESMCGTCHPPRVLVNYGSSCVQCIDFKTLKAARAYAIELHEQIKAEVSN